jgi:hypothetical protein
MTLIHVFLAAPGSLAGEQTAFHQAVGACNEERGLALGMLYVPLTVSKKAYPQGTIDENIRLCSYYLLTVDDTLGIAGNTFDHDWWVARKCCADANLPMREAVALFKRQPEGRPADPVVAKFREGLEGAGGVRCFEFGDAAEFRAIARGLLEEWLG